MPVKKHKSRLFSKHLTLAFFLLSLLLVSSAGCDGADLSATDCNDENFWVTTTVDINDGACNEGHCSLREAVIAANTCTEHEEYRVWLPPGDYELTLRGPGNERGDLDFVRRTSIWSGRSDDR